MSWSLGMIAALWRRDMLRLKRERSRWLGVVLQPLLFWLLIGSGMASSFRPEVAADVDYLTFFFPGILVMVVLFTAIFGTISVIEDRQQGFLQGVLVAPGPRWAMVVGKIAGVASLALLQTALLAAMAPLAGYAYAGIDWGLLALVVALTVAGLTAVGFAMAWALSSAQAYHAVMSMILLPLWILSGAMFPLDGGWVAAAALANPMTYAVSGARFAFDGAAAASFGPGLGVSLTVLAAFAAFSVIATARLVRHERGSGA